MCSIIIGNTACVSYFCIMNRFLNPAFLLRFAIAVGYIILGILLLTMPIIVKLLNKTTQPLFAILLMAYGCFRLYRAYQIVKEDNQ